MRKDMKRKNDSLVALLAAVLCVCACLVGCERRGTAPAPDAQPASTSVVSRAEVLSTTASIEERAQDQSYQKQLAGIEKEKQRIVKQRAKIEARMAQLREYVKTKKKLPPNATDEQVEAALNGAQKMAWHECIAERKAIVVKEERLYAAAQAAVRQRILRKETDDCALGAVSETK